MLALHRQLPQSGTPHEKTALQAARSRPRTGRSTGARLYGLTEEEIGIGEAGSPVNVLAKVFKSIESMCISGDLK
ncbi:MAG: hypothetical protein NTX42_01610 [Methanothrix sp.]|nr:hypothetical protein [Methanothrix sp.]